MTRSIHEAEVYILNQSAHGPQFGANECQEQCHLAYDIPTDGTPDATTGWYKARDRHPSVDPRMTPRGAFNHWVGGSSGHGHVTVSRFKGSGDWSTDFGRTGFWNYVADPRQIAEVWSTLRYVGWSWDIDGTSVKPKIAPAPAPHPHIRAAITATRIALTKNNAGVNVHLRTALSELRRALGGK